MLDNITNSHKGERFYIGGASPYCLDFDPAQLINGLVIGVNRFWFDWPKCDYLVWIDTGINYEKYVSRDKYLNHPKFYEAITCPLFVREPRETEKVPPSLGDYRFAPLGKRDGLPLTWGQGLCTDHSSAVTAAHLAAIMGASEIVFWGVDFTGNQRTDGSSYNTAGSRNDFWSPHVDGVNDFIKMLGQHVKIYKTNPDSPLDCEYLPMAKVNEKNQVQPLPAEGEVNTYQATKAPAKEEKKPPLTLEVLYHDLWETDAYRNAHNHAKSPNELRQFVQDFGLENGCTIADIGAGAGHAAMELALQGHHVYALDFVDNCFAQDVKDFAFPGRLELLKGDITRGDGGLPVVDLIYCADVLEHLTLDGVEKALAMFKAVGRVGGQLIISTCPDGYGQLVGQDLHLTVKDAYWWVDLVRNFFTVDAYTVNATHVVINYKNLG